MRKVKPQSPPRKRKASTRKELLAPLGPYESGVIVFVGGSYHLILDDEPIPHGSIIVAVWSGFFWLLLLDIDEIHQWLEQQYLYERQREEALHLLRQQEFHARLRELLNEYFKGIEKELRILYSVKNLQLHHWDSHVRTRMVQEGNDILCNLITDSVQNPEIDMQTDMNLGTLKQ